MKIHAYNEEVISFYDNAGQAATLAGARCAMLASQEGMRAPIPPPSSLPRRVPD